MTFQNIMQMESVLGREISINKYVTAFVEVEGADCYLTCLPQNCHTAFMYDIFSEDEFGFQRLLEQVLTVLIADKMGRLEFFVVPEKNNLYYDVALDFGFKEVGKPFRNYRYTAYPGNKFYSAACDVRIHRLVGNVPLLCKKHGIL